MANGLALPFVSIFSLQSKNLISLNLMHLDVYPGFGIPLADDRWRMMISGVVRQAYTPTVKKRMLIRMLGGAMDATDEQLASEEFVRRVTPFLADGARKIAIAFCLGDVRFDLVQGTPRNGRFRRWLTLPGDVIRPHIQTDSFGRKFLRPTISCHSESGEVAVEAECWMADENGTTVISDVDDTIKESAIGDRRELLSNTFLRSFRPVDGMAGLYRDWAKSGTCFHYVSSSPCQLLQPLMEMRDESGFPGGSLHLRNFRLRNHVLAKVARIRWNGKSSIIRKLVMLQPGRRFLLIGDSGEADMNIYWKIARKYPGRVAGVFIRRLDGNECTPNHLERFQNALPDVRCRLFGSADELAEMTNGLVCS